MSESARFDFRQILSHEKSLLTKAAVPIVTLSGSFKKDLADHYDTDPRLKGDVLYSRAHYSMAEGVRQQSLSQNLASHLIDPLNYIDEAGWQKAIFTQSVGRAMARNALLRWLKDRLDTIARNRLPITDAITQPLIYLTDDIIRPIISMHYETGNILATYRHTILQYITDPHVRPQYLDPLPYTDSTRNPHPKGPVTYAVFDDATKTEVLNLAKEIGKNLNPNQVVVTGPPVDPRITILGKHPKKIISGQPIHLAVTTGGTGSNLSEIKTILYRLAPLLKAPEKIRLFLYAGTHRDFRDMFEAFAADYNLRIGNLDDDTARIRILYEDSIIDANENLIKYAFPWAHGFITKPSGDMAYDAAAAGCFLLFLKSLGPWEDNIHSRFTTMKIGFDFSPDTALTHFRSLHSSGRLSQTLQNAHHLPPLFRQGAKNTLNLYLKLATK